MKEYLKKIYKKLQSWEEIFVFGFISIYTLAATLVSVNRFWQYDAFWYDFGIFDETFWKLSRFKLPIIPSLKPPDGILVWGDHLHPSTIFIAPLYWLTNRQEIIFIAQALCVGLSAVVFYQISKSVIKNGWVRISLIVSYLGFVGMQNALYTDVHDIVFALLPLSLTFWAAYKKKWKLYLLFLLITLGWKESMASVGVGLGLFLLLKSERNIKVGILTIGFCLFYGIFASRFLIPLAGGHEYSYLPHYPDHLSGWVTELFSPVDSKSKTILMTFATFGFAPILSLATWPLIIEHYLERFVLNIVGTRWDLGFHYNSLAAAIMFVGSLETVRWLEKKFRIGKLLSVWAIGTILMVFFLHRFYLHGPLLLATNPIFYDQTTRAKFNDDFINHVPKNGLIMAQNNMAAHLTHYNVTLLNVRLNEIDPKWIVFDTRPGQNPNNFYPLMPREFDDFVASISANVLYSKYYFNGTQMIFERRECKDFTGRPKEDIPPICLLGAKH